MKQNWLCILALLAVFASCSKDDASPDPGPDPVDEGVYYKKLRVENFAVQSDDDNPTQAKPAVLFNLYTQKEAPTAYKTTTRWDISFNGLYNSFLGGNNGTDANNVGSGGAGKGGILILEKAFDEVTEVPANATFLTSTGRIGTDNAGAFGEGVGWYLYDYGGTIIGDGSTQKQHIAYALGSSLTTKEGTVIPARTVILRTALGDYAKIKMISCYKDLYTPAEWYKDAPKMFFTFEYVLIPAGTTKFEIKN